MFPLSLVSRNYRHENLPFPSLRLRSGHAFLKRGPSPEEKIPPLKKGDTGGFDLPLCSKSPLILLPKGDIRIGLIEILSEFLKHLISITSRSTSTRRFDSVGCPSTACRAYCNPL